MNQVEKRIMELASFELGSRKKYIRAVRRKAVVPNQRYSWMLYEHLTDTEPVDSVVLDVNRQQALEIDRRVAETFKETLVLCVWENLPYPRTAQDIGTQPGIQQ